MLVIHFAKNILLYCVRYQILPRKYCLTSPNSEMTIPILKELPPHLNETLPLKMLTLTAHTSSGSLSYFKEERRKRSEFNQVHL